MVAVTKSCFGKKVLVKSSFDLCKTSMGGSCFSKTAGFFRRSYFLKMTIVRSIFQGFYQDFKQFSILFKISRRLSNGEFCNFSDIFSVTYDNSVRKGTLYRTFFSRNRRFEQVNFHWAEPCSEVGLTLLQKKYIRSSRLEIRGVSNSPAII